MSETWLGWAKRKFNEVADSASSVLFGPDSEAPRSKLAQHFKTAAMIASPALALTLDRDLRGGVVEGVRDFTRDVPWALTWLVADSWRTRSGEDQYSGKVAQGIEDFWDRYLKRATGLGGFEFRMATGWEIPLNTKYNGQPLTQARAEKLEREGYLEQTKSGYRIEAFRSIFLKNTDGSLEILDDRDPRFTKIVGPYLATQIATGFLSGGTGIASKAGAGVRLTASVVGAAEVGGNVGIIADQLTDQLLLKPQAVRDLAKIFENPGRLDAAALRMSVNNLLSQYKHREGPMTEQMYIPYLRDSQSPYNRLFDLSIDAINVHKRSNPFSEFDTTKTTRLNDIGLGVDLWNDKKYTRSFYTLAVKGLSGMQLTNSEIVSLRFMLNTLPDNDYQLNIHDGKFSVSEKQETLEALRDKIGRDLMVRQTQLDKNSTAARYGDALYDDRFSDKELVSFSLSTAGALSRDISQEERRHTQRLEEQTQNWQRYGVDPVSGQPKPWGPKI